MAGEFKTLNFSEGVETTAPTELPLGSIDTHSDVDTTTDAPSSGDVLTWDGSNWVPDVGGAGSGEVNFNLNPNSVAAVDNNSTNDVGDYISSGAGATVARTETTGDIPRYPHQTTGTKITFAAGTADYVRLRFRVPPADRGKKLKIEFAQLAASYVASTAKIELYNYSDAYVTGVTEVALHGDDSSGDSYLPNATGVYYNEFDADDREYYELRIVNAGATAGTITINDFVIGPGKLHSGAVVTPWTAFTPTGNWTTNTTYTGWWRRVGEVMEARYSVALAGAPNSAGLDIDLPSGYTIDTTKAAADASEQFGIATIVNAGVGVYPAVLVYDTTTQLKVRYIDANSVIQSVTQAAPHTFGSGDYVFLTFSVPITEFAGSGVLNVITQDNLSETSGTETPTLNSATSVSASTITWRKVGDKMRADFYLVYSAAGDNSDLTITIPNNKTIDTTKLTNSSIGVANLGSFRWTTSSAVKTGFISFESTTKVNFFESGVASNRVESDQFAASDSLSGWFEVPITEFAGSQSSLVGFSAASATQSGLVKLHDDFVATSTTPGLIPVYKTGSFTPTFAAGTNLDSTPTGTATYTRIGDLVFLRVAITADASAGSAWTTTFPHSELTAEGIGSADVSAGQGLGYRTGNPANVGDITLFSSSTTVNISASGNTVTTSQGWVFTVTYKAAN